MDPNKEEKCNNFKDLANWRIKNDNTIEYSYKGIDLPLVCAYKPNYFKKEFHNKLKESCDNKDNVSCVNDDISFCSFNEVTDKYSGGISPFEHVTFLQIAALKRDLN